MPPATAPLMVSVPAKEKLYVHLQCFMDLPQKKVVLMSLT